VRTRAARLLLVGGGHAHIEVLRRFAVRAEPDVEITLVSPQPMASYSSMLPGVVAGHYSVAEAQVDLRQLAQWAGARFVVDHATAVDPYSKTLTLAVGDVEAFDTLSLDIGSTPDMAHVPGAKEHALGIRPAAAFLAAWETLQAEAAAGTVHSIAIVGGGAGGVEMLLAMQHHLRATLGDAAPRFALITDQPQLLPQHAPAVRAHFGRLLVAREVVLHLSSAAMAVEAGTVIVTHHRRIAVDRILWATSASAQPWLAASGLACDDRGFVQVDKHLRSTSHPFVFAAGDCATQIRHPCPKSGAIAVRQGPSLAANLRRALRHQSLRTFVPRRFDLALIATGGRHAVASRGAIMLEGNWVWRWKDRLDRRFMARYRRPEPPLSVTPDSRQA
jgi:pyridine nucleotide-disulfide oxidoreductase family protein